MENQPPARRGRKGKATPNPVPAGEVEGADRGSGDDRQDSRETNFDGAGKRLIEADARLALAEVVAQLDSIAGIPVDLEGPFFNGPDLIQTRRCGVRFKRAGEWRVRTSDGVWHDFVF